MTDVLLEINTKIDNFLGYEELTEDEKRELAEIREEIKRGEYVKMSIFSYPANSNSGSLQDR